MKKSQKIISIDAETNGLWGNPFAVAAIVYEGENPIDSICLRLPNSVVTNGWVKENVLSTLNFPVTHQNYEEMLKDFSKFYMGHKDATALWHMGHVVEAFLFREMHRLGFIGDFEAPYCPIEVSGILSGIGYLKPDSVDNYLEDRGLTVKGETHNPLFDCEVAAKVYFSAMTPAENIYPPDKVGGASGSVSECSGREIHGHFDIHGNYIRGKDEPGPHQQF